MYQSNLDVFPTKIPSVDSIEVFVQTRERDERTDKLEIIKTCRHGFRHTKISYNLCSSCRNRSDTCLTATKLL